MNLLNDAIEARLGGSSENASIAIILNCEAWDASSIFNESIALRLPLSRAPETTRTPSYTTGVS